jgi:outer membrane receptor protein involved in Fe transport
MQRFKVTPWSPQALAVAGVVLAVAAAAAGSTGGTVRGRVVDRDGAPVVSATVAILDSGFEAVTGVDGSFEFVEVPAGEYLIEARGKGFATAPVERITVAEANTTELVFQLEPVPLREIVVTSSVSILREEPVATVSLDREQIMELPHFGDDLYRAISVLPGTSGGDISGRFNVRGGLHEEVLVTFDDQELLEPFHLKDFQGVFSVLDPEMIGGVELVPGGFTSEYGDRMTGVLDMTARRPAQTTASIGISLTTAWANTGGRFAEGRGRWLGSARRGYLDYILDHVEEDEDDGAPPDPRYWDAFAMIGYDLSLRHSVSAQVLFADDDLIFEEDEIDEITDVTTGYGSRYLWLRHQGVAGAKSFVNTSLYGGRVIVDRDFFIIDFGFPYDESFDLTDVRELDLYGLRMGWQHELSDRHYLRWGVEARSYDVSYDYENQTMIEDPIDDPRFEPGVRINSFHDSYEGEWYALYASDRIRLGSRLTAEVGARYDKQTLTEDDQISPRVNLLYNVGSTGVARVGWGHYFQSQRPYELMVQFGESEFLPAQRAEHWTVGYETEIGRNYTFRVDGYLRKVRDPHPRWETLFDPFHPVPEVATDLVRLAPEEVNATGIEVYLASRKGLKFDWWLSYAWSEIDDVIDGVDTPRYVDQTNAFTASATWRPGPKWSLTGVWTYHTGWPTTAVDAWLVQDDNGFWVLAYDVGPFYQERLDDYHRLDFRASRTTKAGNKGHLTFFVDIQNVYNRDNLRGIAIADPDWVYNPQTGGYDISFPEEYWMPIIPSFGVSWEF